MQTTRLRARLRHLTTGLALTALVVGLAPAPGQQAWAEPDEAATAKKVQLAGAANPDRVVKDRYLVETAATPVAAGGSRVRIASTRKVAESAVRQAGGRVEAAQDRLWTGLVVTADESQIRQIAASPAVRAVYPVLRVERPKTTTTATRAGSALAHIGAASTGYTGKGVKVGVIDTGIDYQHPDLGGSAQSTFPTARVAYGFDFVGDDYVGYDFGRVEDGDPDDCAGHGTHVAGIIGAAGDPAADGARGVAPEVTLGAYRVFGCTGGASTDVVMMAVERAFADGMQVINLSLGSDFESWPSYPMVKQLVNVVRNGVVVVAAAGNAGDLGLFATGWPSGKGVITVAAYEPATFRTASIDVGGVEYAYSAVSGTATAPTDDVSTLQLVLAQRVEACPDDGPLDPLPAGTALLIRRGGCTFREKVVNAITAGAQAAVIYNNVPGLADFDASGEDDLTIPAISLDGTGGASLAAALAGGPKTMTWLSVRSGVPNPDAGRLAWFSSAGLGADLELAPTISAPGSKIYSTVPVEQGGYANMSGTSMASPFVAGAAALLLEAASGLTPAQVEQRLYATAEPVPHANTEAVAAHPEGVFKQGAGLVQVDAALNAGVVASPATIKLGEGTCQTVRVKLTNNTAQALTYAPQVTTGVSAAASIDATKPDVGTTTPDYAYGAAGFQANAKTVTVGADRSATITVKLCAPAGILKGRAGLLYGGWIQFRTEGPGNQVSVPFHGIRGDYQDVKVLNGFRPLVNDAELKLPAYVVAGTECLPNCHTIPIDFVSTMPTVLYHLDYPVSDVRLRAINASTGKTWDAAMTWLGWAPRSVSGGPQPRDAYYQGTVFGGVVKTGKYWRSLPNGSYRLQLRVLKPLGNPANRSHWETFTSKAFRVSWGAAG